MRKQKLLRLLCGVLVLVLLLALIPALFQQTQHFLLSHLPQATSSATTPMPTASSVTPSSTVPATGSAPSLPTPVRLPTGVFRNDLGAPVFWATAAELIVCYNRQWGSAYLRNLDTWRAYPDAATPCMLTAATRYSFLFDEAIHYWPAVDIYCAPSDTRLLEISLSLSEHDWSREIDDIFREQSICMLQIFYDDLPTDAVEALYQQLRQDTAKNEYIAHSAKPKPMTVYLQNGIGCWGYTYSGMIRINIIPVDEACQAALIAKGATFVTVNEVIYADKT